MKVLQSLVGSLIKALFHPVVLISLLGPLILSVNLISLRDALSFPYGEAGISGDFIELKSVLSDVWAYALIDFNVQLYTLMLAWIIFYVEVTGLAFKLIRQHTITRAKDLINGSGISLFLVLVVVLLFFGGIVIFFSGSLSSPDVVQAYLPNGLNISGGIRVPPLESNITWFRGLILIYGITLSIWEQRVLPKLLEPKNEKSR